MTRESIESEHGEEFTDDGNLKELYGALLSTQSVEQVLHEMAVLAARLVSGGLSCGMTMQPNGRPVTVAIWRPVMYVCVLPATHPAGPDGVAAPETAFAGSTAIAATATGSSAQPLETALLLASPLYVATQ